jgi:hypothetical protein
MRRSRLHDPIKILCRLTLLKRIIYKTFCAMEGLNSFILQDLSSGANVPSSVHVCNPDNLRIIEVNTTAANNN